jgi:hypothetical protein
VPNESKDHYSYICIDNKIKSFKSHWSSSKKQILSWSLYEIMQRFTETISEDLLNEIQVIKIHISSILRKKISE